MPCLSFLSGKRNWHIWKLNIGHVKVQWILSITYSQISVKKVKWAISEQTDFLLSHGITCGLQISGKIQGLPDRICLLIWDFCNLEVQVVFSFHYWYLNFLFFSFLLWNNLRLSEKLQRQYREFPYAFHQTYSNISIFCNHGIILKTFGRYKDINIGAVLLAKLQTIFRLPHFFPTKVLFLFWPPTQDLTLHLVVMSPCSL